MKRHIAAVTFVVALGAGCETAAPEAEHSAPVETVSWALDHNESSGVVVSVWGSGPSDVWAAGGQADRGLILHNTGDGWLPVPVDAPSLIWNIYGTAPDDVYAVGERGLALHYDGATWRRVPTGTTQTLYGLWTEPGGETWVVGGDPRGNTGDAVILRGGPSGFQPVAGVPTELLPDALFKIYGAGGSGLIAVGRAGTILRLTDHGWRRDDVPTSSPIISVWGRSADDLYAVGGSSNGEMHHFDGTTWSKIGAVGFGPQLFGVFTAPGEPVFAVGADSEIMELSAGGGAAAYEAPGVDASLILHSVWGDGQGQVYAVGGSLFSYPNTMNGVILRRSAVAPSAE